MTPLVPMITSAKAALNAADTSALLSAVFAINPLPAGKEQSTVRTITIQVQVQPGVEPPTATVNVGFTP